MNTDLTFITNEENQNLKQRFEVLIKDTRLFDVLVGFFYTSGFYHLYKSLERTKKIRILMGLKTSKQTYELIETAKNLSAVSTTQAGQSSLNFSHAETKEEFANAVVDEMDKSED